MQRLIASTKALRQVLAVTNCRLKVISDDGKGNYEVEASIEGTVVRKFIITDAPDWQTALEWAKKEISDFLKSQVGYGIVDPESN